MCKTGCMSIGNKELKQNRANLNSVSPKMTGYWICKHNLMSTGRYEEKKKKTRIH